MNIYFSPLNILNTQTLNREPALGHSMNYHFIRLYTLVNFNYNVLGIELWVRGNRMRCQQNVIVFHHKN